MALSMALKALRTYRDEIDQAIKALDTKSHGGRPKGSKNKVKKVKTAPARKVRKPKRAKQPKVSAITDRSGRWPEKLANTGTEA